MGIFSNTPFHTLLKIHLSIKIFWDFLYFENEGHTLRSLLIGAFVIDFLPYRQKSFKNVRGKNPLYSTLRYDCGKKTLLQSVPKRGIDLCR